MDRSGQRFWAFARASARKAFARARALVTEEPDARSDEDIERVGAEELARAGGDLRAGVAKLAQLMAYTAGPGAAGDDEARRILGRLWDRAPEADRAAIREVVREDLGAPPEELFAAWQDAPIAAASLGQVHAATTKEGVEVAVKVQYPGVAEALRSDLESTSLVRRLAGADVGGALSDEAVTALREAVLAELDYLAEAKVGERFRRAWRADTRIVVPRGFPALSSARVLTAERLRGRTLAEVSTADDDERARVALTIFRFTWGSPLLHRLLNADPNPGNYLALDGDRVGFFDFGCALELEEATVDSDRALWRALLEHDGERFRYAVQEQGLLGRARTLDSSTYRDWERYLVAPFVRSTPFTWTADYAAALADLTSRLVRAGGLRLPPEALLLWRQRLGVAAVLGTLTPTADFRSALAELVTSNDR